MATSTNYGWSEPDNTSLVKDGAQAIRTLGDAIDVSLWNSGYGQAGKNKIINGNFGVWQRGTSITIGASGFAADRYAYSVAAAVPTGTLSQQAFTAGTAPVAGYEGQYFMRSNITAHNNCTNLIIEQRIEDVRTFAGQTVTLSCWVKTDAATTFNVDLIQNFGSGGSGSVSTSAIPSGTATTTGWVRYTATVAVPSITGKTIGAGSYLTAYFVTPKSGSFVRVGSFDMWGLQLEYGSKATPFQTASGGSPQAELAMCQRYYYRTGVGSGSTTAQNYEPIGYGSFASSTLFSGQIEFPVTMRVIANAVEFSNVAINDTAAVIAATNVAINVPGIKASSVTITVASGGTAFRFGRIVNNNNTAGYLAWSAEL